MADDRILKTSLNVVPPWVLKGRGRKVRALQAAEKLIHPMRLGGSVSGHDPPRRIVPQMPQKRDLGFSPGGIAS
jgi:hypothetical protein